MRLRRIVVAVVAAILALAPGALLASEHRLVFRGYSVQVPLEAGWRLLPHGAFDIALLSARSPTHSFGMTASAMEVRRPFATPHEFLGFMRQRLEAEPDRARFSDVEIDAALEPSVGPMCVRARSRARDHGVGGDAAAYLVIEIWNLTCLHPRAPGLAVSVVYYERHAPTEAPGAVHAHGRRFVDSLRFDVPL